MTKAQLVSRLLKSLRDDNIYIVSTDVPKKGESVDVTMNYETYLLLLELIARTR